MQFNSRSVNPATAKHQCLVVGIYEDHSLSVTAALVTPPAAVTCSGSSSGAI